VAVDAHARNDVGQSEGIVLRFKDPGNFVLANYAPHINILCFHERINGSWAQILAPVPVHDLGPDLHLSAKIEGDQAVFCVSDGKRTVSTRHTLQHYHDAGGVGLIQLTGEQSFGSFRIADCQGKAIFQGDFSGPNGTVPLGLKYVYGADAPNPIPKGLGARIDGIGWHPANYPDRTYFDAVRRLKKQCAALGFKGRYFATEIYAGSSYPPGQPSEMQMAKYLVRSLTGHSGLDMEAGPCHPHFTAFPHPQSLCRQTWPVQTLVPCQPSIAYYAWRTLATVLDDFHPAEYPVSFSAKDRLTCFTFERGDKKERLLAAWLPVADADETASLECDVVLRGTRAQKVWGIDVFNGTEQELVVNRQDDDTVLRGVLIKDYPTYLRIRN